MMGYLFTVLDLLLQQLVKFTYERGNGSGTWIYHILCDVSIFSCICISELKSIDFSSNLSDHTIPSHSAFLSIQQYFVCFSIPQSSDCLAQCHEGKSEQISLLHKGQPLYSSSLLKFFSCSTANCSHDLELLNFVVYKSPNMSLTVLSPGFPELGM